MGFANAALSHGENVNKNTFLLIREILSKTAPWEKTTREELEALHQDFGYCGQEAFDDCCELYEESWFEDHDLLVVLVKNLPQEGTFSLASITESDGSWCVRFLSGGPYTGENTDRFVFAKLEKGQISPEDTLFAMFEVP